ncbi:signal peptidase complex subunit 1 isoform X1 [Pyrgilauda ruficollis]|uniref:signal peptidase complex subunit 1 isoform X1 n=1 Tax=Pyrgilauda ruficollis TaxID=221976 RepID=UPI001B873CAF|nr:signal peptidase complex subunit 1 isoform X1 [Pyrgilauda ruficollis]
MRPDERGGAGAEQPRSGGGGAEAMAEAGGGTPGRRSSGRGGRGVFPASSAAAFRSAATSAGSSGEAAVRPANSRAPPGSVETAAKRNGKKPEKRRRHAERVPLHPHADGDVVKPAEEVFSATDYKGQKLAEQIFQGIILVSAVIGFIYGYITEQFGWTVYIVMAGFALSCLLTLPPWPMYRRNPLKWLPVQESGTEEKKAADRKPKRHSKS